MVTNSVFQCVSLFSCQCQALDEFLNFLFGANLSTLVLARSILKQMLVALRVPMSGIHYDGPSKARRPFSLLLIMPL